MRRVILIWVCVLISFHRLTNNRLVRALAALLRKAGQTNTSAEWSGEQNPETNKNSNPAKSPDRLNANYSINIYLNSNNMKTGILPVLLFIGISLISQSCAKQSDPEITLNGEEEMTLYIGDTWSDPGATAIDYKGRDISADIEVSGTVPATSGYTTLDYTVSDKKGNFAVKQRGVTRGFKNTDLEGTYTVERVTTNGGGSQTYTGTITAEAGDIVSLTIDNSNSTSGPVIVTATLSASGTQVSVADQSSNGCSVTYGQYGYASNSSGQIVLNIDFATNCGFTGVYNHQTTWTKQ